MRDPMCEQNIHYWLEALRSGQYQQGIGQYRNHCSEGNTSWTEYDPVGIGMDIFQNCEGEQTLSRILGLPVELLKEVTEKNDLGVSLEDIADWIEDVLSHGIEEYSNELHRDAS